MRAAFAQTSRYSLPPELAFEAELMADLQALTGRSLAEWIAFLAPQVAADQVLPHLESTLLSFGLPQNVASWIAHRAASPIVLPDPDALVEGVFSGSAARWRPLHERLVNLVFAMGRDVQAIPVEGAVHFRRGKVFMVSRPMQLGLGVDFRLPEDVQCAVRMSPGADPRKNAGMTHRLVVMDAERMQGDFMSWMEAAYQHAKAR